MLLKALFYTQRTQTTTEKHPAYQLPKNRQTWTIRKRVFMLYKKLKKAKIFTIVNRRFYALAFSENFVNARGTDRIGEKTRLIMRNERQNEAAIDLGVFCRHAG